MMFAVMKNAWEDLSKTGRMWVLIVLFLAVAGLLAVAMFLGYSMDWIPGLLNKAVP
jgi:hypothetical protein